MPLRLKQYFFWGLSVSLIIITLYLFFNFHLPKGIWVGVPPTFLPKINNCIKSNERKKFIENTEYWIKFLQNKIPIKLQMHNDTVKNLRKIKLSSQQDKINMRRAIQNKNIFRDLDLEFLINAINFNKKKVIDIQKIDAIDFCFKKYNVQWRMNFYRSGLTYKFRKIFLNEDKYYWNNEFKKRFNRKIF